MRCTNCGNRIADKDVPGLSECPACHTSLGASSAPTTPRAGVTTEHIVAVSKGAIPTQVNLNSALGDNAHPSTHPGVPRTPAQGTPAPVIKIKRKEPNMPDTLGPFEVKGLLGEGGMGSVYDGYDPQLDRRVALKLLSPRLAADAAFVERFLAEARAVARISHPNVAPIFSAGSDGDRHYFVMEYISGKSLEELVEDNGPLTPKSAIGYVEQAIHGLSAANDAGIVHRDIKPANLMLNEANEIKVTDFGLAKLSGGNLKLTQAGAVMGSPHFMPPEQGRGATTDFRSDIYSLGATLYMLLTGDTPYDGDSSLAIILKHQEAPVPQIERAPPSINRILGRMMAKNIDERYPSYKDLLNDLVRLERSGLLRDKILEHAPVQPQEAARPLVPIGHKTPAPPSINDDSKVISQIDAALNRSPTGLMAMPLGTPSHGTMTARKSGINPAGKSKDDESDVPSEFREHGIPKRFIVLGVTVVLLLILLLKPWNWVPETEYLPGENAESAAQIDRYIKLSNNSEPGIRSSAIMGLASIKAPRAISRVRMALSDQEPQVRIMVIGLLAKNNGKEEVLPIYNILKKDSDGSVRTAAAQALEDITGYNLTRLDWNSASPALRRAECEEFMTWWK